MNKIELLKNINNKDDRILCSFILDKYMESYKKKITTTTYFLDKRELDIVIPILNKICKNNYSIYYPHEYCEKAIIIFGNIDKINICCLKFISKVNLRHQDYLGTLFALGLDRHVFGDIIIDNDIAYIFVLDKIKDFIINNVYLIGNVNVNIEEISLSEININKVKYQNMNYNVSSNRIDVVIAKIINKSRNDVNSLINKNKVLLNYNILKKNNYNLKENDIFSISGYGKFIYRNIVSKTKKGNIIIHIDKYN